MKHVPHQFEWKVLDPDEQVSVKQKKKTVMQRAGDLDLRKPPLLLKDGDQIGVLVRPNPDDDLQTEADQVAAEAFNLKQAEKKKEQEALKAGKARYYGNDSASVRITFEEEEERALQMAMEESRKEAEAAGIAMPSSPKL